MSPPGINHARANTTSNNNSTGPATHRIRLVPHLDTRRSLRFDPVGYDLREGDPALRIGRFTDRSGLGLSAINSLNSNKLAFGSKVVSRARAEIWVETGGKFHIRIIEVDYQGEAEDIYKSMKIEVEIGREWQVGVNVFEAGLLTVRCFTTAFKNLKAFAEPVHSAAGVPHAGKIKALAIPGCCICLFRVTGRQALFIAPCSHTFHCKCIRPILEAHHPAFSRPLCRTYADLEEDVEVDEGSWEIDVSEEDGEGKDNNHPTPISFCGGEGDDDRMDVGQDQVVRPEVVLEEPEPDEGEPRTGECS
ncbi:hypothetical protein P691DRAFT_798813 [Macrolepiota fuliginosa MF-IS2]|uniref:RING-type domain-containing protein n=1 Tax=Macrolepiota fuliginosa MF-IS2 TaxID=1400762 RepID=A0A9P5X2A0_9AGAR|nr:hypothetical protein P691DRAFT_798813 [Macrolepiota fuliginosa MF-IS2]